MTERPEPFLFERVWAHPSSVTPEDVPAPTPVLDAAGRLVVEHDEGFAPAYESVLAVNPPERLAAWEASWPAGASRGEDD